jgi:hypothetical protein
MIEGLLWYDADPKRDLSDKVARAADRYHVKYGRRPNLCYVNEAQIDGQAGAEVNGVRLAGAPNVLRHHLWIGREEAPPVVEAAPEPEPAPPEPEPEPEPPAPAPTARPPVVRWGCHNLTCPDKTAWAMNLTWCPSCGAKLEEVYL